MDISIELSTPTTAGSLRGLLRWEVKAPNVSFLAKTIRCSKFRVQQQEQQGIWNSVVLAINDTFGAVTSQRRSPHSEPAIAQASSPPTTHPRPERLADYVIVVKRSVAALPDRLVLHPVKPNRLAALKENHHVARSDRRRGRLVTYPARKRQPSWVQITMCL